MNLNDLITDYTNRVDPNREPRKVGRYYASELGSIIMGYKTANEFFHPDPIPTQNAKMIEEGNATENHLAMIFKEMNVPVEMQAKKEIKIDDITLVVKTDFLFKKFVAELKRPARKVRAIPEKWVYQLEATYRAFNLPVQLWQASYPHEYSSLKYTPADERWETIKKALNNYHIEVRNIERSLKLKEKHGEK